MAIKQNKTDGNGTSSSEASGTTSNSSSSASVQNMSASAGSGARSGKNGIGFKLNYDISVVLNKIDSIQMRQQTRELPINGSEVIQSYKHLINMLGSVNIPAVADELKYFKDDIIKVGEFFAKVVEETPTMVFPFLQTVCLLIIAEEQPSGAIAVILNIFSGEIVSKAIEVLLSGNYNTSDQAVRKTIRLLSEWVGFCPFCPNLNVWILAMYNQLKEQQKFDLVFEVSMDIIDLLFRVLTLPVSRANAEPVVFHILTTIQHSPMVFHKIIHRLPNLIEQLKQESVTNEASKKFLQNLVDLTSALMAQFHGYDILYKPLVKALAEFSPSYDYPSIFPFSNHEQSGDVSILTSSNAKVGLVNLGNTCYMNSVLQALTMTKEFSREILLCGSKSPLLLKVQQLMALMLHSKRPELTPSVVLSATRPPGFVPGYQQDSSEFLGYLLETMHEQEVKFKSLDISTNARLAENKMEVDSSMEYQTDIVDCEYSQEASCSTIISKSSLAVVENNHEKSKSHSNSTTITTIDRTFTGKIATTFKCLSCSWQSKNIDSFRDLQLSFPETENDCASNYSVQDLIDYYCSPEKLSGDNQYYCEKCEKLTDAERFLNVISPPRNLILTLKHFKYDQKYHMRAKLMHKVFHDESVSLKVCSPETLEELASVNYSIYAGVVHSGYSMDSGHYYTYAADSTEKWYKFNDSYVTQCEFGELHNLTQPNTPYILFYQMRGLTSDGPSNKIVKVDIPITPTIDELPPHLREYVERDNKSFREDLQRRTRNRNAISTRRNRTDSNEKNDEDDDENQSSRTVSCGDNAVINVNRFIC